LSSRADFGATFRNTAGDIVGRTSARTLCWYPKAPSKFAAVSEDGRRETAIRCGECSGCLEYDAQILRERLRNKYRTVEGQLWAVIVSAAFLEQSKVRKRLSRIASSKGWLGFHRITIGSFACIATEEPKSLAALSSRICCSMISVKLGAKKRNRSYRLLSQGLLVPRSKWGEQTNRFYHRGLPPREKDRWITSGRGGIRSRHPEFAVGVRAINGDIGIYPPEAWRPPRLVRRHERDRKRTSPLSSAAAAIPNVLASIMGVAKAPDLPVNRGRGEAAVPASVMSEFRVVPAPAGPASDRGLTARRDRLVSAPAPSSEIRSRDLSLGSGYRSSVHSTGGDFDDWAARMVAKARERPPPK
jgi:hypothetical protein